MTSVGARAGAGPTSRPSGTAPWAAQAVFQVSWQRPCTLCPALQPGVTGARWWRALPIQRPPHSTRPMAVRGQRLAGLCFCCVTLSYYSSRHEKWGLTARAGAGLVAVETDSPVGAADVGRALPSRVVKEALGAGVPWEGGPSCRTGKEVPPEGPVSREVPLCSY